MTICVIQARMGSSRLPKKSLKDLAGKPLLWHVVERCRAAKTVNQVIVATTVDPQDDPIAAFCAVHGVECFRGSEANVLERYYLAVRDLHPDTVVRVTGDCPLVDPETIDAVVTGLRENGWDYYSNALPGTRTYPRGLDVEAISFSALEKAYHEATSAYEKEHVLPYIWENKKGEFRIGPILSAPPELARTYRLTVDYPEDFELMKQIADALKTPEGIIDTHAVMTWLDAHPEVASLNAHREEQWHARMDAARDNV